MAENKIYGTVAAGVVGIIGVALIIKMFRKKKAESSGDRAVSDENVRIAMELNTAMHPGRNFFSNIFYQPNKDEIFRLGGYITNFDDISKEYRNIYQENLSTELQDALDVDYADFINKLQKVEAGTDTISDYETIEIADALFDEMDGLNWFGRDNEPFEELLRLSDTNFKKVIQAFNQRYPKEDFFTMFNNEFTASVIGSLALVPTGMYSWPQIVEKVTKRYNILF